MPECEAAALCRDNKVASSAADRFDDTGSVPAIYADLEEEWSGVLSTSVPSETESLSSSLSTPRLPRDAFSHAPFPLQRHPCPRQRHHPGEGCNCAAKLAIHVPHGYCRAGDCGSVHAARAHNLRWRLQVKVQYAASSDVEFPIPSSLRVLVEDHQGGIAVKDIRPLSPRVAKSIAKPMSGTTGKLKQDINSEQHLPVHARRQLDFGKIEAESKTVKPDSNVDSANGSRPFNVSFRDDNSLVVEVPVFMGATAVLKPIPGSKSCIPTPIKNHHELHYTAGQNMQARANLARLYANHKSVMRKSAIFDCISFLWAF